MKIEHTNRGGLSVQKKVVIHFLKTDIIYITVITIAAIIVMVTIVTIIIIVNIAITLAIEYDHLIAGNIIINIVFYHQ